MRKIQTDILYSVHTNKYRQTDKHTETLKQRQKRTTDRQTNIQTH